MGYIEGLPLLRVLVGSEVGTAEMDGEELGLSLGYCDADGEALG